MKTDLGLITGFQIFLIILLFILSSFLLVKILNSLLKRNKSLQDPDWGYPLYLGAVLLANAIFIKQMISPLESVIQLLGTDQRIELVILDTAKFTFFFLLISMVGLLLSLLASNYFLFLIFRKGIKTVFQENHFGLIFFLAILVIAFSLLLSPLIQSFMETIIPYPKLPNLYGF